MERHEPLNSTWDARGESDARTKAVLTTIRAWQGPGTLLLITHGVNITAILGHMPRQGGFAVLAPAPDGFRVVAEARP